MKTQHKNIPIGVDNFEKLVDPERNFLFVDKSLFIKELIDKHAELSLIIRPRRWGKTLNMSMLRHFFAAKVSGQNTKHLFANLKIAKEQNGYYIDKYQGKYPVIFVSFKDVKKLNFSSFLSEIGVLIKDICQQHYELKESSKLTEEELLDVKKFLNLNASETDLCKSLKTISGFLKKHYDKKVLILIDEYDTPLNAAYDKPHYEELVNFFKNMFGAALKGNDALEFGVMTGILRLSKNKMLSDLNNLKLYSLMDRQYSQHFGFSETEVLSLIEASNIKVDLKEMRYWYDGYKSGSLEDVYNPWSILNFIYDGGKFKPYWIKTGDEELLRKVLLNAGSTVKADLNRLAGGETIDSTIDEYLAFEQVQDGNDEVIWSLLWCMGYLKLVGEPMLAGSRYRCNLKIPNYEVECNYRDIFTSFMRSFSEGKYDALLRNLVRGNIEDFSKNLELFLLQVPSYYDLANETNYHMLLLAWSFSLNETHAIYSNQEAGLGRPDLVLVPKNVTNDLGLIIEFKKVELNRELSFYQEIAQKGLTQIANKKYEMAFKHAQHVKRILQICLVFYGKQFVYTCAFVNK